MLSFYAPLQVIGSQLIWCSVTNTSLSEIITSTFNLELLCFVGRLISFRDHEFLDFGRNVLTLWGQTFQFPVLAFSRFIQFLCYSLVLGQSLVILMRTFLWGIST